MNHVNATSAEYDDYLNNQREPEPDYCTCPDVTLSMVDVFPDNKLKCNICNLPIIIINKSKSNENTETNSTGGYRSA